MRVNFVSVIPVPRYAITAVAFTFELVPNCTTAHIDEFKRFVLCHFHIAFKVQIGNNLTNVLRYNFADKVIKTAVSVYKGSIYQNTFPIC